MSTVSEKLDENICSPEEGFYVKVLVKICMCMCTLHYGERKPLSLYTKDNTEVDTKIHFLIKCIAYVNTRISGC